MQLAEIMIAPSLRWPKTVIIAILLMTLISGAFIIRARFDMRPEHLLAKDEIARAAQEQVHKEFALHDLVVLGVVNEQHSDGVFNPETLKKVYTLSKFAAALVDPKDPERRVVSRDIIAPDNVDNIFQTGPGQVRFGWLMKEPPSTRAEALKIRDAALANPLIIGTMVSADGKALAIYLPISKKDFAYTVAERLRAKINELGPAGNDKFHITGLPVAEGTFGKAMFLQMKMAAPMTTVMLFLVIYLLFRSIQLSLAPIILTACTVTATMGLLIGTGHILNSINSLLPIFIMPVAVIGSVHILSLFVDYWHRFQDAEETISHVMNELFAPIFFTSLTSAAGFAAFAVAAPFHPLRDFCIFVAVGIMLALVMNIFFIPAYVMTIKGSGLERFNRKSADSSLVNRHLRWMGKISSGNPWLVIAINLGIMIVEAIGILMIQVNDNPITWFTKKHEIRMAEQVLNSHFSGTHEAYLMLSGKVKEQTAAEAVELLKKELEPLQVDPPSLKETALSSIVQETATAKTGTELLDILTEAWNSELDKIPAEDKAGYNFWTAAVDAIDKVRSHKEIFKRPDMLRYLADFQAHLAKQGDVGKSTSISDIMKKVHQELYQGDPQHFTIPDTVDIVADILTSLQNSHNRDSLRHFVTQDYTKVNLWLQLRSSDSKSMERVVKDVEQYSASNPPPVALAHEWAGQTYLNMTWQKKRVKELLKPLPVSALVICALLVILFRSPVWGLLAMMPLAFTVALMYGGIGLIGKDCDMPLAVSSLLLSLAVDFAIHFLQRARMTMARTGDWAKTVRSMFDEPARAVLRNIIIIAVGFTPLLAASVMPYQMAGVFLAVIMLCSGVATLWMLSALLTVMKGYKVLL